MRVAHLTTIDISLRYLVLAQLTAVRERGDEAIGISAPGPHVAELEARGIRHVTLPSSARGMDVAADLRAAVELWRILRRERPDVLHTHNPKPGVYGRIVGRLAGVPRVVNTVHGLYATPEDRWAKRAVVYALEAVASRCSHVELVQNEEDLALLTRWRLSAPAKTHLLGNGVDLARFDPGPAAEARARRTSARAALGVTDDRVVVGCVGRLVAEKGYPELFAAAERLGDGYVVLAVGPDDPTKADAIDAADRRRGEAAGVRFLGMRTDVDDLYRAMDVFVLPSHREGFPRAAMEAAAMGLPVVATDIRGCRQVVAPGETGALVPVDDVDALVGAIATLGTDAALRARQGAAARARAEANFDERAVVAIVLDAYDGTLRRGGGRHPATSRAKRAFDLAAAGAALVVLAPVLAAVAVAVRIGLGSPVLFRQPRPGLHGEVFTLTKFRTMCDDVGPDGMPLADAERLTRLGRWLRATSLDELPELVHVVRGQMSLVGPRPLLVDYLDHYTPEQARRHDTRPGLTGLAQVEARNATTWAARLATDVRYVDEWSFGLDLRILARTVRTVVTGAGVAQEGEATMARFDR